MRPISFQTWLLLLVLILCGRLATAQTPAEIIQNAPWYERDVASGVVSRSYRFDSLFSTRQVIHIFDVDMNHPDVGVQFGFRQNAPRVTVSQYAAEVANAVAAVNGNFFDGNGSVQHLKVNGTLITPTLNPTIADEGGVLIGSDGDVDAVVRPGAGWASLPHPNIMATNIPVVINGSQYPYPNIPFYQTDRHPRTIVGVTPDNHLLLVAVDGRSSIAAGMTFVEMAQLMLALGVENAVNMDGGGSTTAWDSDLPGNGVGNVPSDGGQRTVANAIIVTSSDLPTTATPVYDARRAPGANNASPYAPVQVNMVGATTASVTLSFVNTGTATWTPETVFLRTTEPPDHASTIQTPGDWLSASRPTTFNQGSVPPGGTGTFTFTITAPTVTGLTNIEESYGLVTDQGEAFGPQQNRVYVIVVPPATQDETIVESRLPDGALNPAPAYQESGTFSNTTAKSSVSDPPVIGLGARFNNTIGSSATFRPVLSASGTYNVYVTMGPGSNNNALASYVIGNAGPNVTGNVALTFTDTTTLVNRWKLLASNVPFKVGGTAFITFTNVDGNNASGKRFVMDAVRFELVAPEPPVTESWVVK